MVYANSIERAIREGIDTYRDRRDAAYVSFLLIVRELGVHAAIPC
jgi:hypothetical protein